MSEFLTLYQALQVLITPIYEELFFRGYLLQAMVSAIGNLPAGLLSSLLFSVPHYLIGGWKYALLAGLLGIRTATATIRTRSLWLAIGLHHLPRGYEDCILGL